jgi:hypothetical protein
MSANDPKRTLEVFAREWFSQAVASGLYALIGVVHPGKASENDRLKDRLGERCQIGSQAPPARIAIAVTTVQCAPGRKNCSAASFGTMKGVADFGSGLNLANTDGLSRKCFLSVSIRAPLAG